MDKEIIPNVDKWIKVCVVSCVRCRRAPPRFEAVCVFRVHGVCSCQTGYPPELHIKAYEAGLGGLIYPRESVQ